jgi:hypothetical protein
MKFAYRFGKRIAIPSTLEIRQSYKLHCLKEGLRERWAAEEGLALATGWDAIIARRSDRLAAAGTDPRHAPNEAV